jgi:hypothetical protein
MLKELYQKRALNSSGNEPDSAVKGDFGRWAETGVVLSALRGKFCPAKTINLCCADGRERIKFSLDWDAKRIQLSMI